MSTATVTAPNPTVITALRMIIRVSFLVLLALGLAENLARRIPARSPI